MNRLILFTVLLSLAAAARFSTPFRRSSNVRESLIREGKYQELKSGSQKMSDILDEFYLVEITLGTPAQKFNVALDTQSSNLWVVDVNCTSQNFKGNSTNLKHTYNSTASRTFYPGGSFYLPYEGGDIYGSLAADVLTIAGFKIYNQDFGDAKTVPQIYTREPVDGVLGLGFPDFAFAETKTPMQNLIPQLDAPLITFWLEKESEGTGGKSNGMVTYGGVDNKRCSETIQYVPLANLYTWEFYVDAVEVGSYSRAKRDVVTPATGSGWTGVPNEVFSGIVKQTKAVYDFTNGIYTVPCSTMGTQPDIFIVIHGITYAIKSEEYVLDLNLKNGQCALAFFGTTHDPAWIFGDAFLRSYCHVLDFGKRGIGLAKSIHGK